MPCSLALTHVHLCRSCTAFVQRAGFNCIQPCWRPLGPTRCGARGDRTCGHSRFHEWFQPLQYVDLIFIPKHCCIAGHHNIWGAFLLAMHFQGADDTPASLAAEGHRYLRSRLQPSKSHSELRPPSCDLGVIVPAMSMTECQRHVLCKERNGLRKRCKVPMPVRNSVRIRAAGWSIQESYGLRWRLQRVLRLPVWRARLHRA